MYMQLIMINYQNVWLTSSVIFNLLITLTEIFLKTYSNHDILLLLLLEMLDHMTKLLLITKNYKYILFNTIILSLNGIKKICNIHLFVWCECKDNFLHLFSSLAAERGKTT